MKVLDLDHVNLFLSLECLNGYTYGPDQDHVNLFLALECLYGYTYELVVIRAFMVL